MREHLHDVREHGVLFDTPRFVRNLESSFRELVAGL
jgi:predicted O-linked N-acetylglucosamine transferase (SPINDLY family)